MRVLSLLALASLLVAGCIDDGPQTPDEPEAPAAVIDEPEPVVNETVNVTVPSVRGPADDFHSSTRFAGCEHRHIVHHVPLADIQAALPDGFTALSAEAFYSLVALGSVPELPVQGPLGILLVANHPCGTSIHTHNGGEFLFFWTGIEPPEAGANLPQALGSIYQFEAHGTPLLRDLIELATGSDLPELAFEIDPDQALGSSVASTSFLDGKQYTSMRADNMRDTEAALSGMFNIYSKYDDGLMVLRSGYSDSEGPKNRLSADISCDMTADTPWATLFGITDCSDPTQAPLALVHGNHEHVGDTYIWWDQGWTSGPINEVPHTPYPDLFQ